MKNNDELMKMLGRLFVVGFPGDVPPAPFLDFIREEQIGGLILFEENCTTHAAARANIAAVKSACVDYLPLVAIDQEGGQVCRLRGAPAEFPAASHIGASGDIINFQETYRRSLLYMESLGINLNLAPVADIGFDKNSYIRERSFGSDPETVGRFVQAAVEVSSQVGMLSCLKHFPGLGEATIDPHYKTASADYDRIVWDQREKIPFEQGVLAGADLIMTTHMTVPKIDDSIVTVSSHIVDELIRGSLGFDGPVITDDLTMKGAAILGRIGERAVAAFNAGHDILLFGRDFEAAMEAYDYLVDAFRRGEVPHARLQAAINRVAGLRFKLEKSTVNWDAN